VIRGDKRAHTTAGRNRTHWNPVNKVFESPNAMPTFDKFTVALFLTNSRSVSAWRRGQLRRGPHEQHWTVALHVPALEHFTTQLLFKKELGFVTGFRARGAACAERSIKLHRTPF
jgi:hypothetical protein